ncbi:hypothetical protein TA5114_03392 [Cognatishimia activa]|uniref:Uncharacterized protein n=1 Tax=Cognatishimia activa TaxID=1715691 RepID=A0A0P1J183_9RHOB|nr:hypothetical protein TA5113_02533 [Cognatishimia activa]CUK27564.1 hypothetical protein TA5114_03392 [Cognatishimia activa]
MPERETFGLEWRELISELLAFDEVNCATCATFVIY